MSVKERNAIIATANILLSGNFENRVNPNKLKRKGNLVAFIPKDTEVEESDFLNRQSKAPDGADSKFPKGKDLFENFLQRGKLKEVVFQTTESISHVIKTKVAQPSSIATDSSEEDGGEEDGGEEDGGEEDGGEEDGGEEDGG